MYATFRELIEKVRKDRKLTQRQLADQLGITVSTYNTVTQSERNLLPTLVDYLNKLGVGALIYVKDGKLEFELLNHGGDQ